MSNLIEDFLAASTQVEEKTEDVSSWLEKIGVVEAKPKAKKATAKKTTAKKSSKIVEQAEKVYETIDDLIVPDDDCTHHWIIGSDTKHAIGTCKLCNGEKWFNNNFAEQSKFNGSLSAPTGKAESKDTLKNDLDVQDLKTAYSTQQSSDLSGEAE